MARISPVLVLLVLCIASFPVKHVVGRHSLRHLNSYYSPSTGTSPSGTPDSGSSPTSGTPSYGGIPSGSGSSPSGSTPHSGSSSYGSTPDSGSSSYGSGSPNYGTPSGSSPDSGTSPTSGSSPSTGSPSYGSPSSSSPSGGSPDIGTPSYGSPSGASPDTGSPSYGTPSGSPVVSGGTPSGSSPDTDSPTYGSPSGSSPVSGGSGRGSCGYWGSHAGRWPRILSTLGSLAKIFGGRALSIFGSRLTLLQAIQNPNGDAYSALARHGTAALLNSVAVEGYSLSTAEVRQQFNDALESPEAATVQAAKFERANLRV